MVIIIIFVIIIIVAVVAHKNEVWNYIIRKNWLLTDYKEAWNKTPEFLQMAL